MDCVPPASFYSLELHSFEFFPYLVGTISAGVRLDLWLNLIFILSTCEFFRESSQPKRCNGDIFGSGKAK